MDFGNGRGEYNLVLGNYANNYDIGVSLYHKVDNAAKNTLCIVSGGI